MKIKPQNSKGTRDFLPAQVRKRNYIFNTIKSVFVKYGFEEIETPAMERIETLTGKYGAEGDQLLFKILNSGDFLKDASDDFLKERDIKQLLPKISEKGLRYDLTVPLARYVVQHQNELVFPFKRFHISAVWRADRPQRGRYQEFFQCDADCVGSLSLLNEVELCNIFSEAFKLLGIEVSIRISNRKLLDALCTYIGETEKQVAIVTIIDKMDKIGIEGAAVEFSKIGLEEVKITRLISILQVKELNELEGTLGTIESGRNGIDELKKVMSMASVSNLVFDIQLARGLNYYTGVIWEIAEEKVGLGSIGSGGRYDNLTELFGGKNMPGVGISFGVERIYDVMETLNLFPGNISQSVQILFACFNEQYQEMAWRWSSEIRKLGISAEVYPDAVKIGKQINYANDKGIPLVAVIGEEEFQKKMVSLKNMKTGEQQLLTKDDLVIELLKPTQ